MLAKANSKGEAMFFVLFFSSFSIELFARSCAPSVCSCSRVIPWRKGSIGSFDSTLYCSIWRYGVFFSLALFVFPSFSNPHSLYNQTKEILQILGWLLARLSYISFFFVKCLANLWSAFSFDPRQSCHKSVHATSFLESTHSTFCSPMSWVEEEAPRSNMIVKRKRMHSVCSNKRSAAPHLLYPHSQQRFEEREKKKKKEMKTTQSPSNSSPQQQCAIVGNVCNKRCCGLRCAMQEYAKHETQWENFQKRIVEEIKPRKGKRKVDPDLGKNKSTTYTKANHNESSE